MKKFLSVLMVSMLIIATSTSVFAVGQPGDGTNRGDKAGGQLVNEMKMNQNSEFRGQMDQEKAQVRLNHDEICQLREQIRDCAEELRLQIRARIANTEQVTSDDMALLKESLKQIRQERENIRTVHQGKITQQVTAMHQFRLAGGFESALMSMENIRNEQQLRIVELTEILKQMENLLDTLSD